MAITKTRAVQNMQVYPASESGAPDTENAGNPSVVVSYHITFDDSTDDELPAVTPQMKHLQRFVESVAEDGTITLTATDVTGEDQLVQDVCAALWTD